MNSLLSSIITIILSILTPVITSTLTIIVKRWVDEKIKDMENKKMQALIKEGVDIVLKSVDCVQQTYVDTIKDKDFFNKAAQEEAFMMAKERAFEMFPVEVHQAIMNRYGDPEDFVEMIIESYIAQNKKERKES